MKRRTGSIDCFPANAAISVVLAFLVLVLATQLVQANPHLVNVSPVAWIPSPPYTPAVEGELVGPGGGANSTWNQFASNSSTGTVLNATGEATSIGYTTDFSEGRVTTGPDFAVLHHYWSDFSRGQTRTLTITNLVAGGLHSVWLLGYQHNSSARERTYCRWTANNDTTSPTIQYIDNRPERNGSVLSNGYNYVVFEDVKADGSGQISFTGKGMTIADGADDDYRLLCNGFQIEYFPPPAGTVIVVK